MLYGAGPGKKNISVLDRDLGKIELIIKFDKKRRASVNGGLIKYNLAKFNNIYIASDIELLAAPMELAKDDILFLHHVLELCYNFLSINQPAREIFDLLLLLYTVPDTLKNCFTKKIFLAKFFDLTGVANENISSYSPTLRHLICSPIDIMLDRECDEKIHAELTHWLLDCTIIHPRASKFNTTFFLTNFLKNMDRHEKK
jgi:hypothetical protein